MSRFLGVKYCFFSGLLVQQEVAVFSHLISLKRCCCEDIAAVVKTSLLGLSASVVRLGHALLHDLLQVGVLHGGSNTLLIIDLFVN